MASNIEINTILKQYMLVKHTPVILDLFKIFRCKLLFCRLSVGCNHLNYIDDFCDINAFEPPVHKVLPCVCITLTDDSENANADWRRFFQAYNQLKDLTEL